MSTRTLHALQNLIYLFIYSFIHSVLFWGNVLLFTPSWSGTDCRLSWRQTQRDTPASVLGLKVGTTPSISVKTKRKNKKTKQNQRTQMLAAWIMGHLFCDPRITLGRKGAARWRHCLWLASRRQQWVPVRTLGSPLGSGQNVTPPYNPSGSPDPKQNMWRTSPTFSGTLSKPSFPPNIASPGPLPFTHGAPALGRPFQDCMRAVHGSKILN